MHSERVKLGRNDVCPCGSGSKYKRCCLSSGHSFPQTKEPISRELIQKSMERLKNRAHDNLGEECILYEGRFKIKMSEVILDLAHDLLELAETKSQYKKAIGITCMAWNLSVLSGVEKEKSLDELFNKLNDEEARNDTFDIISAIIEKKNRHYSQVNRLIVDYEVLGNRDNIHLNVMSVVQKDELAELN
jgi:hypothetical protein